ncbi:hypothetical protein JT359_08605 [Candidatus Poribacteria bacterium]|nr:hypothetical protein [Candidatus Poribacteria bacterium]
MSTITYSKIQELVSKLPESKLPLAYRMLTALTDGGDSPQEQFLSLSVKERQQLSQQAEQLKTHYEDTAIERSDWQTGEFIDES